MESSASPAAQVATKVLAVVTVLDISERTDSTLRSSGLHQQGRTLKGHPIRGGAMATQTVEATDHKLLAAGEWQATGEWAEVKSPYDGSVVGRVAQGDEALAKRAIEAANEAFESTDFSQHERARVLRRAAELFADRAAGL